MASVRDLAALVKIEPGLKREQDRRRARDPVALDRELAVLRGEGGGTQRGGAFLVQERDGTLRVDSARLAKMMATAPEQVEAMFAAGAGLTTALDAIAAKALDKNHGLGSSETNYAKAQDRLADDLDDMREATEKLRTRMTQQFAAMDAKVAAYKSTQSFLEQQIKAWNAGN